VALKWKRTGAYTLEIEGWIIAKCFTGIDAIYVLTHNGGWIGNFETAAEAQQAQGERQRANVCDVRQD
jgi:hypothetical protein